MQRLLNVISICVLLFCSSASEGIELQNKQLSAGEHEISVNGVRLSILVRGSGSPFVLLHGFGASVDTWRNVNAQDFTEFQLIGIDLKGFGKSGKPRDGKYSMTDQAELILALFAELNLSNVVLAGHSFGGGIALLIATESAQKSLNLVSKLILIDPACYPQEFPDFIQALRAPLLGRLSLATLPNRFLVKQILGRVFFDHSKITAGIVAAYQSPLDDAGAAEALVATARSIVPDNVDAVVESFRAIKVPTQIYWGREDRIVLRSSIDGLAARMPTAQLIFVDRCGHAPQEECPELVIPQIQSFLSKP